MNKLRLKDNTARLSQDWDVSQRLEGQEQGQGHQGSASLRRTHHLSLLIWSPKPGVSIKVSLSFTPFSSMTVERERKGERDWTPVGQGGGEGEGSLTVGHGVQLQCLGCGIR